MDDLFTKNFLRVSEVAEFFSLSPATIYNLVNRGELPSVRVGSNVLIPAPALKVYVDQMNAPGPSASERVRTAESYRRTDTLDDQVRVFEHEAGMPVEAFLNAWNSEQIEDTTENARMAMLASGLHRAIEAEAAATSDRETQPA